LTPNARGQAIERGLCAQHLHRAGQRALDELHAAPEDQRDDLPDDDAQPPGGQDGVQRARVQRLDDGALDHGAEHHAHAERGQCAPPGTQAGLLRQQRHVAAQRQEAAMGEIDDLHDAEDQQQPAGDDEQDRRRAEHVEQQRHGDELRGLRP
jgi:hypothetical protein